MSTRAIVTSQPDVTCYVCERRLLRGEQPELFLVDAVPRTVCELCAPRAAYQGWPRGDERQALSEPVAANRRGAGLLGRLREAARPARRRPPTRARRPASPTALSEGADLLGRSADGEPAPQTPTEGGEWTGDVPYPGPLERSLEAFNASEYPRRIASLARSLGAPEVSVALDEDLGVATIVVAWELCWYRYRVDPDEQQPEAQMIAEGRVLEELGRAERLGNAHADELGALSLMAAAV
jgi:hypothetical protein